MCFESVCGSFAVGFFCLYWIEEEWQTWWYAPQKNERHRNCMWRHFLYSQYFQVMVNYPCGNDHISHRSTCYTGTLESMIFRTSQLVGYVSSVPWRAWRVWYMHSEQWRCGESPRKIHWINWFFELDYFSATTWSRKIINISTCSKGGAYSKEWHSQKTRYKYIHISQSFPICYSCCCERSTFWWFFWGGSSWILGVSAPASFGCFLVPPVKGYGEGMAVAGPVSGWFQTVARDEAEPWDFFGRWWDDFVRQVHMGSCNFHLIFKDMYIITHISHISDILVKRNLWVSVVATI